MQAIGCRAITLPERGMHYYHDNLFKHIGGTIMTLLWDNTLRFLNTAKRNNGLVFPH